MQAEVIGEVDEMSMCIRDLIVSKASVEMLCGEARRETVPADTYPLS